jgi:hypothetical protein
MSGKGSGNGNRISGHPSALNALQGKHVRETKGPFGIEREVCTSIIGLHLWTSYHSLYLFSVLNINYVWCQDFWLVSSAMNLH